MKRDGPPGPQSELFRQQPRTAQAGPQVLTVTALTRQVKGVLEPSFSRVLVRGEVTGYRGPNTRGHLYFAIKDAEALVDVKVWASAAPRLRFELRDGLEVTVDGRLEIYAPSGRYSLIANRLEPSGHGARALALQQLRERLEADGVIGPGRRPPRPLPLLPRRVGLVTSRTGAALRDFLEVATARHPGVSILLADARVQGEGSAREVVRALERLQATDVDIIVVTRGGGSAEDLWTFNEEPVVRALAACRVPVVSAIGHEVDVTLADFAADVRAPTPSAAAERVVPAAAELLRALAHWQARLHKATERRLMLDGGRVEVLRRRLMDPRRLLDGERLRLSDASDAAAQVLRERLREGRSALASLSERLQRCHPGARLRADQSTLSQLRARLLRGRSEDEGRHAQVLRGLSGRLVRRSPGPSVAEAGAGLATLRAQLYGAGRARLDVARHGLERQVRALHALSPLSVMARGYSVVFRGDGTVLRRAEEARVGEGLSLRLLPPGAGEGATLSDAGEVQVTVTAVRAPT